MPEHTSESPPHEQKALPWLEGMADFLDNRFRIPGTQIRFGADFLVGLIPYVGDVITFFVSGFLVLVMTRYGASGKVLLKMIGNIWLDGMVGTIPFLGDIFDLRYRANMRNLNLLQEHFGEGKHEGSAWGIIFLLILTLLLLVALSIYVVWRVLYWVVT